MTATALANTRGLPAEEPVGQIRCFSIRRWKTSGSDPLLRNYVDTTGIETRETLKRNQTDKEE